MKLSEKWFELYESLYGTQFNKIATTGTFKEGYENYPIKSLEELRELCEENYPKNEIYISLYNYDTDEPAIKWDPLEGNKFEKYAKKDCILFRLRKNTDIIREEIDEMDELQRFMFIRRTLNLGNNHQLIDETKILYNTIKTLFNIDSWVLYNGFNECYLYVFTNELQLKNPTLTYYYFYKFIENYTNLETLTYSTVSPFSQLISLPGSPNSNTRLYTKPYDIEMEYKEVIKNSETRTLESFDLKKNQDTSILEDLLKTVDNEISKRLDEGKRDIWEYNLDTLFDEQRE